MEFHERFSLLRAEGNWSALKIETKKEIAEICTKKEPPLELLREVSAYYLGSLFGDLEFFETYTEKLKSKLFTELANLRVISKDSGYISILDDLEVDINEIVILLGERDINLNTKIAAKFRKIARPDIAIMLCEKILEVKPASYIAFTVQSSAYADLDEIDKGIKSLTSALKYSYDDGNRYCWIVGARLFISRFERDGDLDDWEKAYNYVVKYLAKSKPDRFIANTFLRIAFASGDEKIIAEAESLFEKTKPVQRVADKAAVESSQRMLLAADEALSQIQLVENIDRFYEIDEAEFLERTNQNPNFKDALGE
jgi:hypothetical protein